MAFLASHLRVLFRSFRGAYRRDTPGTGQNIVEVFVDFLRGS